MDLNRGSMYPAVWSREPQRDEEMFANGYLDELAYDLGAVDHSLPFPEFKAHSYINERARAAEHDPDFSRKIRVGVPGIENEN